MMSSKYQTEHHQKTVCWNDFELATGFAAKIRWISSPRLGDSAGHPSYNAQI